MRKKLMSFALVTGIIFWILVYLVGVAGVGYLTIPEAISWVARDDVTGIRVDENTWLNFDEAAALVRKWSHVVDDIEATGWSPIFDDDAMLAWMSEVTPMFEYEGLVRQTHDEIQGLVVSFAEGFAHNHIAGRSDCETYVALNRRFTTPISSWYEHQTWPATLAHELAHVQQGPACSRDISSQALLENTAQIMSWEVLAALANQGSPEATLTLVYEMRGNAMSAARAMAVHEDRLEDYEKLFYDVFGDDPHWVAAHEKNLRFWVDRQDELYGIQMRYGWAPLNRVFKARHEQTIYKLALDNSTHAAEIDDLVYFIQHMEELVEWALVTVDERGD